MNLKKARPPHDVPAGFFPCGSMKIPFLGYKHESAFSVYLYCLPLAAGQITGGIPKNQISGKIILTFAE